MHIWNQLIPLEHHKVTCVVTQNSGLFILNVIPIIKRPKGQNILKQNCFSKKQCGNPESLIKLLITYKTNWLAFQNKQCFKKQAY